MQTNGIITLDLHGCNIEQAKIAINAALRRSRGAYRIRLVHGFHGGTAIRDMVRKEYRNKPGILRLELGLNDGETDLVLREYY